MPAITASYSTLLERVGHYLFGIRSSFSDDQKADIEDCIRDGLRDVYSSYMWSFFRPVEDFTTTAPYATGTVTIASGVVTLSGGTFPTWAADGGVLKHDNNYYEVERRDSGTQVTLKDTTITDAVATSYELGRPEYDMPTGFEAVANDSDLTYEPGKSDFYPPVRRRHDSEIRRMRQDDPYHDRPVFYSVRTMEFEPTIGSRRRLAFYPTPDAAYVLHVPMILRPTMISETDEYPVGGEMLSQLITEACLAAAERNFEEQEGVHTKRFAEMLPIAIADDMERTSPTSLGRDAPRDEYMMNMYDWDHWARSVRIGGLTLDGTDL